MNMIKSEFALHNFPLISQKRQTLLCKLIYRNYKCRVMVILLYL